MSGYILAIDQGTTGTKAHLLRADGAFETLGGFEHKQIFGALGKLINAGKPADVVS